jgi:hypothetical protein
MAEAGAVTEQIIMNVQHLVSDWHFMRFVRLALGTYIGIQAYQTQSILSALLAGFIIVITNSGWWNNDCSVPLKKKIMTLWKMWNMKK